MLGGNQVRNVNAQAKQGVRARRLVVHLGLCVAPVFLAEFQQVETLLKRLELHLDVIAHIEFFVSRFDDGQRLYQA